MDGPDGRAHRELFPPGLRLRRPGEFKAVFRRNRRSRDAYFAVLGRSTDRMTPRLGLAVSRKVSPRAVIRNRLKRMIRESFRRRASTLPAIDIVVIVQPGAGTMAPATLRASLDHHWQTIKNRCAPS